MTLAMFALDADRRGRRAGVPSRSSWQHALEGLPDVAVEAASLHAPSTCSWQTLTGARQHPRLGRG
jgi:hypothetical protein